jgi:osmotically-inducible protein OsmY
MQLSARGLSPGPLSVRSITFAKEESMGRSMATHPGIDQPKRVEYPDSDLAQRVRSFLNSRHFPAFRNLDVYVENGSVFVKGHVGSFYEKQVALNSCQRVAGVLSLVDEIDVDSEPLPLASFSSTDVKPR